MNALGHLVILYNKQLGDDFYRSAIYQILKNIQDVPKLSSYRLAEKCFISEATLRRISQKIGFSSYTDFKMQIALDLADARDNIIFSPEEELWQDGIVSKSCDYLIDTIEAFRATVSDESVTAASGLLRSVSEINFFTQVTSSFFRHLQRRLLLDGKDVNIVKDADDYAAFNQAQHKDHAAFFLTFEGWQGAEVPQVVQEVRKKGAKIIFVSPYDLPCAGDLTDVYIKEPYSSFRRDIFGYELILSCITTAYNNRLGDF